MLNIILLQSMLHKLSISHTLSSFKKWFQLKLQIELTRCRSFNNFQTKRSFVPLSNKYHSFIHVNHQNTQKLIQSYSILYLFNKLTSKLSASNISTRWQAMVSQRRATDRWWVLRNLSINRVKRAPV